LKVPRQYTTIKRREKFYADGKKIATGSIGNAHIWDAETGEKLHTIGHHGNEIAGLPRRLTRGASPGISFVAFSPDGKRIVTGSTDATARIWTLE
jgi:WD40 repeat protein